MSSAELWRWRAPRCARKEETSPPALAINYRSRTSRTSVRNPWFWSAGSATTFRRTIPRRIFWDRRVQIAEEIFKGCILGLASRFWVSAATTLRLEVPRWGPEQGIQ